MTKQIDMHNDVHIQVRNGNGATTFIGTWHFFINGLNNGECSPN
jgi:hypothetical protein